MTNNQNLTDVETAQFFEFLDFIIKGGHTSEIVTGLKAKGFDSIRVAVEPIREAQAILKEIYAGKSDPKASVVITSGHINVVCV
jgi:hypothetical protein